MTPSPSPPHGAVTLESEAHDVVARLIALRDTFRPAPGIGPQTVGLEAYRARVTGNTLAAIYDACALIHRLEQQLAAVKRDADRYRWLREFRSPTLMLPFVAIAGPGGYSQWIEEPADERIDAARQSASQAERDEVQT